MKHKSDIGSAYGDEKSKVIDEINKIVRQKKSNANDLTNWLLVKSIEKRNEYNSYGWEYVN